MEFFADIVTAVTEHPGKVMICIGFPVFLAIVLKGDGVSGGWYDSDCDGDGGD
ncbi:MAG: hypothetical protein PVI41_00685 [Roseobacter sp.]|jgi:hypothetical protein